MEVESPKLISNISLNNTNNNSESESQQLGRVHFDPIGQDDFDILENIQCTTGDETVMSDELPESSQNHETEKRILSSNDNDYLNPEIEFCFCGGNSDSTSPNVDNLDNYNECDNKEDNVITTENEYSNDPPEIVEHQTITEMSFSSSDSSNQLCNNTLESTGDKKDGINSEDIIDYYHDSQWNPKKSDTYKNSVNNILNLSENTLLDERRSLNENVMEQENQVSSLDNSSNSSKSSIVHLDEEKGGISDKRKIELSDDSSPNVIKNDSNINNTG